MVRFSTNLFYRLARLRAPSLSQLFSYRVSPFFCSCDFNLFLVIKSSCCSFFSGTVEGKKGDDVEKKRQFEESCLEIAAM